MTESPRDMIGRLKLIASGERDCDLSDNDEIALRWLIAEHEKIVSVSVVEGEASGIAGQERVAQGSSSQTTDLPRREPETPPQVEEAKARLIAHLDPWIVLDARSGELADGPHALDLIDALIKSAQREPETPSTGWQPIETAPKDGTHVIYFTDAFGQRLMGCASYRHFEDGSAGWIGSSFLDCNGGESWSTCTQPTHWMPLPALPSAETPDTE